jgi:hypothetical protein
VVQELLHCFRSMMRDSEAPRTLAAANDFADLYSASFTHPAVRVFFLAFPFLPSANGGSEVSAILRTVLASDRNHWTEVVGPTLLLLADYPMTTNTPAQMGSDSEQEWLERKIQGGSLRTNLAAAALGVDNSKLLTHLLAGGGSNIVDAFLMHAAKTDFEHLLKILENVAILPSSASIVRLLQLPNVHGTAEFGRLCSKLLAKKLLTPEVFKDLCESCFTSGEASSLELFAAYCLFGDLTTTEIGQHSVTTVASHGASVLRNFAPVLFEALTKLGAGVQYKIAPQATAIRLLLEYALFLEQKMVDSASPGDGLSSAGKAMVTTTMWLAEASAAERHKRSVAVGKVLEDTAFPTYLAELMRGNKDNASLSGGPDISAVALGSPRQNVENWAQRTSLDVVNIVFGFICVVLEVAPASQQSSLFATLLREPAAKALMFGGDRPEWALLAPPKAAANDVCGILRTRLVDLLKRRHGMMNAYKEFVLNNDPPVLFTCADHFSLPVLDILKTAGREFREELFTKTALSGIRLKDFAGLADANGKDGRLRKVERQLSINPAYEVILDHITSVILERKPEDFEPVGGQVLRLEGDKSVVTCVIDAANVIDMLDGNLRVTLQNMIYSSACLVTERIADVL